MQDRHKDAGNAQGVQKMLHEGAGGMGKGCRR